MSTTLRASKLFSQTRVSNDILNERTFIDILQALQIEEQLQNLKCVRAKSGGCLAMASQRGNRIGNTIICTNNLFKNYSTIDPNDLEPSIINMGFLDDNTLVIVFEDMKVGCYNVQGNLIRLQDVSVQRGEFFNDKIVKVHFNRQGIFFATADNRYFTACNLTKGRPQIEELSRPDMLDVRTLEGIESVVLDDEKGYAPTMCFVWDTSKLYQLTPNEARVVDINMGPDEFIYKVTAETLSQNTVTIAVLTRKEELVEGGRGGYAFANFYFVTFGDSLHRHDSFKKSIFDVLDATFEVTEEDIMTVKQIAFLKPHFFSAKRVRSIPRFAFLLVVTEVGPIVCIPCRLNQHTAGLPRDLFVVDMMTNPIVHVEEDGFWAFSSQITQTGRNVDVNFVQYLDPIIQEIKSFITDVTEYHLELSNFDRYQEPTKLFISYYDSCVNDKDGSTGLPLLYSIAIGNRKHHNPQSVLVQKAAEYIPVFIDLASKTVDLTLAAHLLGTAQFLTDLIANHPVDELCVGLRTLRMCQFLQEKGVHTTSFQLKNTNPAFYVAILVGMGAFGQALQFLDLYKLFAPPNCPLPTEHVNLLKTVYFEWGRNIVVNETDSEETAVKIFSFSDSVQDPSLFNFPQLARVARDNNKLQLAKALLSKSDDISQTIPLLKEILQAAKVSFTSNNNDILALGVELLSRAFGHRCVDQIYEVLTDIDAEIVIHYFCSPYTYNPRHFMTFQCVVRRMISMWDDGYRFEDMFRDVTANLIDHVDHVFYCLFMYMHVRKRLEVDQCMPVANSEIRNEHGTVGRYIANMRAFVENGDIDNLNAAYLKDVAQEFRKFEEATVSDKDAHFTSLTDYVAHVMKYDGVDKAHRVAKTHKMRDGAFEWISFEHFLETSNFSDIKKLLMQRKLHFPLYRALDVLLDQGYLSHVREIAESINDGFRRGEYLAKANDITNAKEIWLNMRSFDINRVIALLPRVKNEDASRRLREFINSERDNV
ncbi:hypothetical protein PCE1_001393 [Barthelona sp. PCE]